MDNFDNEFNKVIEQINSDFENIVGQSIENSVNKEPVKYKKNLKSKFIKTAKEIIIIATIVLAAVSTTVVFAQKIQDDREETTMIESYIQENYGELVIVEWEYDGSGYKYDNQHSASIIAKSANIDEAIYLTWFSMMSNRPQNMNEIFQILGRTDTFEEYLRAKGFVTKDGEVDLIAYSETYKNIVEYNDSLNKETGKGSK